MANKKKQTVLILGVFALIIAAIIICPTLNKETILDVEAPELIFVGETGNLKITSNNESNVTTKYGFISSDKTTYKEDNPNVILTATKSGQEEITVKSKELVKTVFVVVCDQIKISNTDFELNIGDSERIEFNITGQCLAQYNISVEDSNIAEYQNGVIFSKEIGSTNLIITRANEKINYPINVINSEISFNLTKTEFNIGDKYTIPVINKNENLVCSSDSDIVSITASGDGCYIEALKEGTTTIKATVGNWSTEAIISIKNPNVEVENITMSKKAIRIAKGQTYTLTAQIIPENATNKTVTYISNNSSIASVSNGIVHALSYGTTTIEARTNNGKKAIISIIVTGNNLVDSYESSTLNYWIDKRGSTYVVTNIWVDDAYSQFKTAITSPKKSGSLTPRIPQTAKTIITNTINEKGYQGKGLVAVNASAMVSSDFGKKTPNSWYGTSQIPLIINNGIVIRNSANEEIKTDDTYIIYGLKRDGNLTYYKYTKGNTSAQRTQNKEIFNNVINDGVLHTFGFKPVLLENGQVVSNSNDPNIRQAICQVDKNNFILITNTSSNRSIGFTFKNLANEFKNLNCKTALNLDGGGSTCEYYKGNSNVIKNVSTPYSGRLLSDMIYFVER